MCVTILCTFSRRSLNTISWTYGTYFLNNWPQRPSTTDLIFDGCSHSSKLSSPFCHYVWIAGKSMYKMSIFSNKWIAFLPYFIIIIFLNYYYVLYFICIPWYFRIIFCLIFLLYTIYLCGIAPTSTSWIEKKFRSKKKSISVHFRFS